MIGHAVSNATPIIGANRIGKELTQVFYGSSFVADMRGDKVAELDREEEGLEMHAFDRGRIHSYRASWGFFRDRRPELYGPLLTADGQHVVRSAGKVIGS